MTRQGSAIGRIAAVTAVIVAIVAVSLIVLSSGSSYSVKAVFMSASQIVSGDLVEASGNDIGTISNVTLTPNGQAELTLNISNSNFIPLRQGTLARIREVSLSGIANRYVDLQLAPGTAPKIPNGGTIPASDTSSEVDVDELFDTLDAPTRQAIQNLIRGSAAQFKGESRAAAAAFQYLNPALASTSMLFAELNRNTAFFTRFIVKSGDLVATIAQRQADLSALVQHLATTTEALASQHPALGEAIQRLPGFMTQADTTFANLRGTLTRLTPLVNASKPVAPKLQELLATLEPLAQNAVPAVHNLAQIVYRPGPNNDLTDLTALGVPLAAATVNNIFAGGKERPGAFPASTTALAHTTPELAVARPYAVDLTGWFEGFSHPGGYDANGAYSRVAPVIGVASLNNGTLNILPAFLTASLRSVLAFGSNGSGGAVTTGQGDRCPGSMERGAIWYPYPGYPCSPNEVPTGK
jgi:phospholipid/cholesterol/gamma-HCH transport system substrate-binding protein